MITWKCNVEVNTSTRFRGRKSVKDEVKPTLLFCIKHLWHKSLNAHASSDNLETLKKHSLSSFFPAYQGLICKVTHLIHPDSLELRGIW